MQINKEIDNANVIMRLSGRLDTRSYSEFQKEINELLPNAENLVLDFEDLEYISSAGLRVLLSTQKKMAEKGEMKIINVSDDVMDIFEITRFIDVLTIE